MLVPVELLSVASMSNIDKAIEYCREQIETITGKNRGLKQQAAHLHRRHGLRVV